MKIKLLKRIWIAFLSTIVVLSLVVAIHVYTISLHKKKADGTTVSLARIDFKQPITVDDAGKISAWLYQQKGITHALCNELSGIAVFSYSPVSINAGAIIENFKTSLHYKAEQFIPDQASLKSGCPAGF